MNVYDFDNTIYRGESVLDLFFFYIKKTPGLIRYLPKVFYALWRYKRGEMTVEATLEKYASFVEDYFRQIEDPAADAKAFWDGHMHKIKPFYKKLQREDDVIVTASPEISMREICARLGVQNCVGSVIDEKTGKIIRLCMRSHKIPAFLEAFPDAGVENFYTDSPKNDAPLIELAKHAFVVKGDQLTQIK